MHIEVTDELISICFDIVSKKLTLLEWSEIESDDMFQSKSYCGGFDADEKEFCFSSYSEGSPEKWFQFSLSEAERIVSGTVYTILCREAS
jgi:hypothetical protein